MREPAKTPHVAQSRYVRVLQLTLSCISKDAQWFITGSEPEPERRLTLSQEPLRLRTHSGNTLWLRASQRFAMIEHPEFEGEWKSSTRAYVYELGIENGSDGLIGWHWHPITTPDRPEPHTHIRIEHGDLGVNFPRLHIPGGRVAFEEVVRFAIVDLGVGYARDDWEDILADSLLRFKTYRTWG